MKKIGLLSLALVLALGALGVGYASWTDTIFLEGKVCTGSVELEIIDCSNTWIWKMEGDGIFVEKSWDSMLPEDEEPIPPGVPSPLEGSVALVAWADADDTSTAERKEITVNFGNAFPCANLTADFLVHYAGSVPAMVDVELTGWTDANPNNGVDDCALLAPYATVTFYTLLDTYPGTGPVVEYIDEEITDCPLQMHYCDYVYCEMTLDLDQLDELEDLCCNFTAEIKATQWNECL